MSAFLIIHGGTGSVGFPVLNLNWELETAEEMTKFAPRRDNQLQAAMPREENNCVIASCGSNDTILVMSILCSEIVQLKQAETNWKR